MNWNYVNWAINIAIVFGLLYWVWYVMQTSHTYHGKVVDVCKGRDPIRKFIGLNPTYYYGTIFVDKGESKTVPGFKETQIVEFVMSEEWYAAFKVALRETKDRQPIAVITCRARPWTPLRLHRATIT